ncbi:MAG TPA: VWA domain-containing protein [Pyrinomonadaceae bacterium]|jgi:Ca-activated chloride channel family protein|nr:VWA domain-containing protein [Pyrinomonadaceae bacterium]
MLKALLLACALLLPSLVSGAQTITSNKTTRTRRTRTTRPAATTTKTTTKKTAPAKTAKKTARASAPIAVPRLPPLPATNITPATQNTTDVDTARTSSNTNSARPSSNTVAPSPTQTSDTRPVVAPAAQTPAPTPTPKPDAPPADAIEDDEDVVRVTSNLVVVPVAVVDAQGSPVQGLKREDFRLEEDGRAQEIAQIGDPDQVPLDIAILLDVSSSVSERFHFEQQSAARFLKEVLKPTDRAAVFAINERGQLVQALASAESASAKLLTIPAATGPTPTAFYDSVVGAARYLAQNAPGRNRRVIVAISDGEDNFSEQIRSSSIAEYEATAKASSEAEKERVRASRRKSQQTLHGKALAEVQRELQRADVVFYSINPTGPSFRLNDISTRAQNGMQQLAETTGGSPFVPEKLEELNAIFRQIAAELRSQYLLQYYPNNEAPPGKYLSIKVRTPARPELRVRARQGYYVPKPK